MARFTAPLGAQRRWGADSARARSVLQQASTTRHNETASLPTTLR